MERKEALEQFQKYVSEQTNKMWEEFQAKGISGRERLAERLAENILLLLRQEEKKREQSETYKAGFLTISYLQSGVADGCYDWYLELQDKNGVLDETERVLEVSMKEFFFCFEKLEQSLKTEARRYVGKIQEADCEAVKLEEFRKLKTHLAFAAAKAYQKIRDSREIKELPKETIFWVTIGEYKGTCQLIGLEDSQEGIQEKLEEKLFSDMEEKALQKQELTRRRWIGEKWEEKQVVYKNLMFSDFKRCQTYHMEFVCCNLTGADFSNTVMQECSMMCCVLHDVSFEQAALTGVLFFEGQFAPNLTGLSEEEKETVRGIFPASFRGAVLERVNFTGARLDGCDFCGAVLKEVVFEDASMQGAIFDRETADKLDLTDAQRTAILLKEAEEQLSGEREIR